MSEINRKILKVMVQELNTLKLAEEIHYQVVKEVETDKLKKQFIETVDTLLDDEKKANLLSDEIYNYYLTLGVPVKKNPVTIAEEEPEEVKEVEEIPEETPKEVEEVPEEVEETPEEIEDVPEETEDVPEEELEEIDEEPEEEEVKETEAAEEPEEEDDDFEEEDGGDECSGFGIDFDPEVEDCRLCMLQYTDDYLMCQKFFIQNNPPKDRKKSQFNHSLDKPGGIIDMMLEEGITYGELTDMISKIVKKSIGKTRSVIYQHYGHLKKFHSAGIKEFDNLSAKTPAKTFLKLDHFPKEK